MYHVIGADGKQYGPVTAEQLRQWLAEGRANASTMVRTEGGTDWKPLSSLPEFSEAQPPPPMAGVTIPTPPTPPTPVKLQNYLAPAILTTLFCCLPFGIVAIVYAAQVNTKLLAGDVAGATNSAKNAKLWTWLAFGFGLAIGIIYFFGALLLGLSGMSGHR